MIEPTPLEQQAPEGEQTALDAVIGALAEAFPAENPDDPEDERAQIERAFDATNAAFAAGLLVQPEAEVVAEITGSPIAPAA